MGILPFIGTSAYHRALMKTARANLVDQPSVAIVVACMACEIYAEQVLSQAFAARGLQYLEGPLREFVSGTNLKTPRVRKVYVALTDDPIHEQLFWSAFEKAVGLRNSAIHSGLKIQPSEASEACDAADQVLAHLETVMKRLRIVVQDTAAAKAPAVTGSERPSTSAEAPVSKD